VAGCANAAAGSADEEEYAVGVDVPLEGMEEWSRAYPSSKPPVVALAEGGTPAAPPCHSSHVVDETE